MKTQVLIIGAGLSTYFCKKELKDKAIVISSNKMNNSLFYPNLITPAKHLSIL